MSPILGIWASQNYSRYSLPTSFESIATTTVGAGGTASISFTSIPSTYTHLQIRVFDVAGTGDTSGYSGITFNSDTGTNYTRHQLYGNGSNALSYAETSTQKIFYPSSRNANYFSTAIIDILDYANTSKYKTVRLLSGLNQNGSGGEIITLNSGVWMNTNAITSITFTPYSQYQQYSSFALYGIKGI